MALLAVRTQLARVALLAGLAGLPAFATGIQFTCDVSISASVCTTLNTTVAGQYASVFTNANASIYIKMASISGVASSAQILNGASYTSYFNALSSTESGANDVTAVNSLGGGTTNPVVSGNYVAMSSALGSALGFSVTGVTSSLGSCSIGGSNCYDGVITMSNSVSFYYGSGSYSAGEYDFVTAAEHETDEILGTTSCLNNTTSTPSQCEFGSGPFAAGGVSAADLFRYSANGTRSFLGPGGNQALGSTAYFSINGGATNIVSYNNTNNGADYGDFSTNCSHVQDAFGCNTGYGTTILNDGGAEIALLDAVGYNLTSTGESLSAASLPEPGTLWIGGSGAILVLWIARRRRRASATPPVL